MAVTGGSSGLTKPRRSRDGLFLGTIVVLGAIVACLRLFVFQPFSIPSQSMTPTLIPGDYVLVSKVSYGYGPYSLLLVTATTIPTGRAITARLGATRARRGKASSMAKAVTHTRRRLAALRRHALANSQAVGGTRTEAAAIARAAET